MVELAFKLAKIFPSLRFAKIILFLIFVGLFSMQATRDIFIQSASNAFISVTSFVAVTIFLFHFLQKTSFDLQTFLHRHKKFDILIAAFLGILPGCGGAIMVMTEPNGRKDIDRPHRHIFLHFWCLKQNSLQRIVRHQFFKRSYLGNFLRRHPHHTVNPHNRRASIITLRHLHQGINLMSALQTVAVDQAVR